MEITYLLSFELNLLTRYSAISRPKWLLKVYYSQAYRNKEIIGGPIV